MKWAFWIAAVVIAYTYAGYPCWLRLRTLWRLRPVKRGAWEPNVSIVMIVRNEEEFLEKKLQNVLSLDYPADRCEIVVVSDGSTDGTEAILRQHGLNPRIHAVMTALPEGKASRLNDAMVWAQGELVVFTDVRQKIESGAIRLLVENFADHDVGSASGELMLGDPEIGEATRGMGLYWRIEKAIRELESASGSVVGATGALYAVRRHLVPTLPAGTILDDVYIPMSVVRQGLRVVFDGRARAWDKPDLGAKREFARKVRTLGGNYELLQLAPWLLSSANPMWFEFISHKVLRLLVPFALSFLLAGSLILPGPVYRIGLLLQLALYGLSLAAFARLFKSGPVARAADAAGVFVLLNTAALVAFGNFVAGRRATWSR